MSEIAHFTLSRGTSNNDCIIMRKHSKFQIMLEKGSSVFLEWIQNTQGSDVHMMF